MRIVTIRCIILGVVLAAIGSSACIGYGLGQESVVFPPDRYDEGRDVGYEAGFKSGYATHILDVRESMSVTVGIDGRWCTDRDALLPIEECIDSSIHASNNHAYYAYDREKDIEHNIYWMNLHDSCAYWLEYLLEIEND